MLYGGLSDEAHTQRVFASPGRVTAHLRNEWKLNAILNDGAASDGGQRPKERTDHRHHAVDAVAIALTGPATVKALSDAAQRAPLEHRRRFASLQAPWDGFVDCVRNVVDSIVVSHRVSKKVSGALHEETIYSAKGDGRRTRELLSQLTRSEVEEIADMRVKQMVMEKLGDGDPKKVFSNLENLPCFEISDGRRIPIKRVRLNKAVPTFALGEGRTERQVTSESNHHLEVFAELDEDGNEVEWDGAVVSMAQAYRRLRLRQSVVQRDFGPQRKFVFSLAPTETIECHDKSGGRSLFVVRKMSRLSSGQLQVGLAPVADARKAKKMQTSRAWLWATPDTLRERSPRKVLVSPLGGVEEAHD